ncbi:hypothetical protein [Aquidulcibacter sp.]|jgi:hypothetical protein|uniref:hypothetical protein n=1 Tax=Aquidulcibacter sp. TaxID=2052990 RepID=UPI0025BA9158|nr:hypothetical protein [Aquidulcibacter sp.]MCA3064989.1 hypothetical protein [Rhodocyclaceae bacterium]MCA3694251.1 hypothetical protein [Aquidulcibacter sp.]
MSKPVGVSVNGATTTTIYEDGESVQHHQSVEVAEAYALSVNALIEGDVEGDDE